MGHSRLPRGWPGIISNLKVYGNCSIFFNVSSAFWKPCLSSRLWIKQMRPTLWAETAQACSTIPFQRCRAVEKFSILKVPTCVGDVSGEWVKKEVKGEV